ncbi:glycosyltransferase family 2 protein [uncultured Pseudoteredinibacter sp.]|uniref:glycosyltransferase family 2 protein n=1 Tax=uncultured Pseudoteredinibacter sp. TaxID=1641701 RepID=UPI00261A2E1A|nr:glycosyltransferase family 2 protein [uncultured Pseudoteredinibacter sp.]
MQAPHLTASVVLYFSKTEVLQQQLDSLQSAMLELCKEHPAAALTLYWVDNSVSSDYHQSLIKLLADKVLPSNITIELIRSPANRGYGDAHNQALGRLNVESNIDNNTKSLVSEALAHDYHLLLNPDVYLSPGCLLECFRQMESSPEIGLLTGQIANNYEAVPHVAKRFPGLRTLLGRYLRLPLWLQEQQKYIYADKDPKDVFDVELAGGCFYFCRLSALRSVAGFDDRYFLYFEDFDLCQRLRNQAWVLRYSPDIAFEHDGGGVKSKSLRHQWFFFCSAFRFYRNHGWRW